MLEKPNIPEEKIIARLQEVYGLQAAQLTFLPIGADLRTAVYRVVTVEGTAYFLKLRRNFREVTVLIPLFLKEKGLREILIPVQTRSRHYWAGFGEYRLILYPFIEGQDGFARELTNRQRQSLGAALKMIHTAQIPLALREHIRKEAFTAEWREKMRSFLRQVQNRAFIGPAASELAEFIRRKQTEISRLIERSDQLASRLSSTALEFVLCHSDIHGGNLLVSETGELYIVDWDDPILAPRERDLMFIGGGVDEIWKSKQEEALFYEGYGEADINLTALAYYRHERVIEDLVVICEQLLLTEEGGADREQAFAWFKANFEPGGTIEIAERTHRLLS